MKLDEVPKNYDHAAPRYDRLVDMVFGRILGIEQYRAQTIDLLGDLEGKTVLDVGCGTGRNFPLLVPRVGGHGKVLGLDYSEGMLDQARRRVRNAGWDNVQLIRGDAATLETAPKPVDAIVAAWCLGIVYDLEAALNHAVDALRPGGTIAIMDFQRTRPARGPLRWLYPLYSTFLQKTGIDSPEDMDDAKIQSKWAAGRQLLQTRLDDFHEQTYLQDMGLIVSGRHG